MMTNQELSELLAVLGIKDDIVNVTKRDVNVAFRKRVSSWGKSMKLMRPKVVNLVKMFLDKLLVNPTKMMLKEEWTMTLKPLLMMLKNLQLSVVFAMRCSLTLLSVRSIWNLTHLNVICVIFSQKTKMN